MSPLPIKKKLITRARSLQERYPNAFLKMYGYVSDVAISDYSFESMKYSKLVKICSVSTEDWVREEQLAIEEKAQRRKKQMEEAEEKRAIIRAENQAKLELEEKEEQAISDRELLFRTIESICPKGLVKFKSEYPSASKEETIANIETIARYEVINAHKKCSWDYALEPSVPYRDWKKSFVNEWSVYFYLNNKEIDNAPQPNDRHPITFNSFGHNLLFFCPDEAIDYSLFPDVEHSSNKLQAILNSDVLFIHEVYDWLLWGGFSNHLIVFSDSNLSDKYPNLNSNHFAYLKEGLEEKRIPYCDITDEDTIRNSAAEHIIVYEVLSSKDRSIQNVINLRTLSGNRIESVGYYSLILELPADEMRFRIAQAENEVQVVINGIGFSEKHLLLPNDFVLPIERGDGYVDYRLSDVVASHNGFVRFIRLINHSWNSDTAGVVAFVQCRDKNGGLLLWQGDIFCINPTADIDERRVCDDLRLRYQVDDNGALSIPVWVMAYRNSEVIINLTK